MNRFFKAVTDAGAGAVQPRPAKNIKIHVYMLGGSGCVTGDALVQNVMAARKEDGYPAIDLALNAIDMDITSDTKAKVRDMVQSLEPMLQELANRQDSSGLMGCLRSIRYDELNLSQEECSKTTREYVLDQVPAAERASVGVAFDAVSPKATGDSCLGWGGQGDPLVGYVVAVSHQDEIFRFLERDIQDARNDPSRTHVILLLNSFHGSAGYNLAPVVLQAAAAMCGNLPVFAVFDGGLFKAHSAAYTAEDYLGDPDVAAKAIAAMDDHNDRGLLKCLKAGIFMTPINPDKTPYFLCPVNKIRGEQRRHSCIENLIATRDILDIICGKDQDNGRYHFLSSNPVLVLERSADAPDRPVSWVDLGMNADTYLRLIRMLALGAATRNLIWNQDDALIANIPAISSILEKGVSLSRVKADGSAFAETCAHLLERFYDYGVTGTNFELEGTPDFVIEDNYRLMNLSAVRRILGRDTDIHFAPSVIGEYKQMIGDKAPFQEKRLKSDNPFNISIKRLIDRVRHAASVEDLYIRLFRTQ